MQYSGLLAFISGLVSVTFGLIFTLTITRRLLPEEYGQWGLLLSIVNYLLISEVIFSYWSTRQIARNEEIGKTSIISSSLFSLLILPVFIVYSFFISVNSEAQFDIMLMGLVLIPVSFISQNLAGINLGHKPHTVSFSQIIFQAIKIPIALTTVVVFNFDVLGVVLAVFVAFLGKIIVQLYYAREKLKGRFYFAKLKWWLKFSWIPLFGHLPNYLQTVDVAIYSLITGSVVGIAYFHAAYAIAAIVGHSGAISQALYPKLLANKTFEGISKNINHILYFGILLVGISVIFSKPALYALNPLYVEAWPIVIAISFRIFLQALRTIPIYIVFGTEQIDTENYPKFSKLINSNLFKMPKFLSIFNVSYVIILIIFLQIFSDSFSELELVFWWAIIGLIIEIPISAFLWIYSKKYVKFSFPKISPMKYLLSMFVLIIFFSFTSEQILNYDPSIYVFLPSMLLELVLCILIFVGMTLIIDRETRILFRSILKEIKILGN